MNDVERHVREIAERVAADLGLEVIDVELHGVSGKSRMLRVFLDKDKAGSSFESRVPSGDTAESSNELETRNTKLETQQGGVTHEDCVAFSNEFGTILDAEDGIPGSAYTLEVSSPGLDRKLVKAADYQRFRGQLVRLTTREPIEGRRNFQGRLQGLEDGRVALTLEQGKGKKVKGKRAEPFLEPAAQSVTIELANVEKANLVPEW
jgi:ribosome maturation factor RimP